MKRPMYDPKFEKAVQHKMEELEFRPSESVWVNIEKTLPAERRRRVIPLFWRIVIPAALVLAVGGAYYFGERAGRKAGAAAIAEKRMGSVTGVQMRTGVAPAGAGTATVGAGTAVGNTASAADAEKTMVAATHSEKAAGTGRSASGAKGAAAVKRAHSGTVIVHEDFVVHAEIMPKQTAEEYFAEASKTSGTGGTGRIGNAGNTRGTGIGAYLYTPGLEGQRFTAGVHGAGLATNKNLVSVNTLSRVKRPWEAGFVAGGGFDRLNSLNEGQLNNPVSYAASSLYALNRAAFNKNSVSEVRPGASLYAGIYLQKAVSDRWTFHTGLDLHYYSTGVSVGQPMNIVASPPGSLLVQRSPSASATAPVVYTVGTRETYTNRYYMLELPVAMQYRLNRSRLLPLFLEGGASISRVMGADALLYNPMTGYYLKSAEAINKTQLNILSAVMIGLPFHGIRIQAGPEVQYALTPLINGQGLGDQHFFYGGVRLVVLPGRR